MIKLALFDSNVSDGACNPYKTEVETVTRLPLSNVVEKIAFERYAPDSNAMKVADVQGALKSLGFFPGGQVDGIYGYRTQSAIRLFQEYVRAVEKMDCLPDGQFGPQTEQHVRRWLGNHNVPNWSAAIDAWRADSLAGTEFAAWLALLEQVKAGYTGNPNRALQMVNAFSQAADTRKVAQWDFSPKYQVHLIGIRWNGFTGKFDDIFVLLIKGLVFKFQGSTEPGASVDPRGTPWLIEGQHNYHFGWHKQS